MKFWTITAALGLGIPLLLLGAFAIDDSLEAQRCQPAETMYQEAGSPDQKDAALALLAAKGCDQALARLSGN